MTILHAEQVLDGVEGGAQAATALRHVDGVDNVSTPQPYSAPRTAGELVRGRIPTPTGGAVGTNPKELLSGGTLNARDLLDLVPQGTPNTFAPSTTIPHGFKYQFTANGQPIEIKLHSPDGKAALKFPGSNSGTQWTAQIKVNGKLLGQDGTCYTKASNLTHIVVTF